VNLEQLREVAKARSSNDTLLALLHFNALLDVVEAAKQLNAHLAICYGDHGIKKTSVAGMLNDMLASAFAKLEAVE